MLELYLTYLILLGAARLLFQLSQLATAIAAWEQAPCCPKTSHWTRRLVLRMLCSVVRAGAPVAIWIGVDRGHTWRAIRADEGTTFACIPDGRAQ